MKKRLILLVRSVKRHLSKLTTTQVNNVESKGEQMSGNQLAPNHKDYFTYAKGWADDIYTETLVSRNRYQMAFFVSMVTVIALAVAIAGLVPMQHLAPIIVNHYSNGQISVRPMTESLAPKNQAEVESDIVRYVINRAGFDPISYREQYKLTYLLSNNETVKEYVSSQAKENKHSPINLIGNKGYRSVHVESVVFLDSVSENQGLPKKLQVHHNLAQVNFTITDHLKHHAEQKPIPKTAIISWEYHGTPSAPDELWRNWDGFTVTHYREKQRNIAHQRGGVI